MAICKKCNSAIYWTQRDYGGVLKWIPLNRDMSDHWTTCGLERWAGMSETAVRAKCDRAIKPFWTVPDSRGSYRTVRQMPPRFGEQPEGELF